MIRAAIVGDPNKVPQYILAKIPQFEWACRTSMARIVIGLQIKIVKEKLTGQVLKTQTGRLRRSISASMSPAGPIVTGIVGTNVEYAAIHEFGGKTGAHQILPKRGKALAFNWKGKDVVFAKVNHPGSIMPERSFMRTALNEMKPQILQEFQNAIFEVIGKA